jgi:hypothetical protein
MKKTTLAAVLLAGTAFTAMPAQADFVLSDLTFRDLGATGFGNAPRLLTLQQNVLEAGGTVAGVNGETLFVRGGTVGNPEIFCTTMIGCQGGSGGGTNIGTNESHVFSIAQLGALTGGGWVTGDAVGLGLDTNQTGNSGPLTFASLQMTVYNSAGVALGSFGDGNNPIDISEALLAAQQGNGNSVFDIRLDAAQQAQYDALIAANGGIANEANLYIGLRAAFGCGAFGPAVCGTTLNFSSNDGADSFLAFNAVPGPVLGAGLPGLLAACGGLFGLNFWRRRRNGATLPA